MLAGLSGVLATCIASSILSLVVVLETTTWLVAGSHPLSGDRPEAMPCSFRWAVFEGRETFPRGAAAAILILFGLETLAMAVSSLNKVAEGVSTHWPSLTPRGNTIIACLVALGLVATYQVDRLGPVYTVMGAIFAPDARRDGRRSVGKDPARGAAPHANKPCRHSRLGDGLRCCLRLRRGHDA